MVEATFTFPRGFLWGTATSSHQVEGNNKNNNWWAWEQEPGRILEGGKSGLACDWWGGRWREDLDRAVASGQTAHRMSIEWSRIQPSPDRWDGEALNYYREILRGLVDRGLTPLVSLHHFTDPLWFSEMGGWEAEEAPSLFAAYAGKVVQALQEYVNVWCTINEPNVLAVQTYHTGAWPPGKRSTRAMFRAMLNLGRAHGEARQAIQEVQQVARVGMSVYYRAMEPAHSWNPLDRLVVGTQTRQFNDFYPRLLTQGVARYPMWRVKEASLAGTLDYLGVNYYTKDTVAFSLLRAGDLFARRYFPEGVEVSPTGYIANRPQGIAEALRWGHTYGLPMMVTENGVEDAQDRFRPGYLLGHLHQIWRAINHNLPVKGYFHWTLTDNFEWERGWVQRFGLWELDPETQVRRKRPSADLYAEICRANAISEEMVRKYAPQVYDQIFPG
jgi:beta-glucosidase